MQDSERQKSLWHRRNSAGFPKFCLLLDDFPTTSKVFHRSFVAAGQYRTVAHRPLFRAEKKGDPVPKMARTWPKRLLGPSIAQRRLGSHASEKHWWSTSADRLPNSFRLSSEQNESFGPMADRCGSTTH